MVITVRKGAGRGAGTCQWAFILRSALLVGRSRQTVEGRRRCPSNVAAGAAGGQQPSPNPCSLVAHLEQSRVAKGDLQHCKHAHAREELRGWAARRACCCARRAADQLRPTRACGRGCPVRGRRRLKWRNQQLAIQRSVWQRLSGSGALRLCYPTALAAPAYAQPTHLRIWTGAAAALQP